MSRSGSFEETKKDDERKPPARVPEKPGNPNPQLSKAERGRQVSADKGQAAVKKSGNAKASKKTNFEGAKKPKDMPRRPLSAYNFFFRAERERLMTEPSRGTHDFQGQERSNNPEMFALLGKEIAKRWKSIPADELEKYKEMAALDMERYCREMSEYRLKRAKLRRLEGTEQSSDGVRSEYHGPLDERGISGAESGSTNNASGEFNDSRATSVQSHYHPELSSSNTTSLLPLNLSTRDPYAVLSGSIPGRNEELLRPRWAGAQPSPSGLSLVESNVAAAALQAQQIERLVAMQQHQLQYLQYAPQQGFLRPSGPTLPSVSSSDIGLPVRTQQVPIAQRLGSFPYLRGAHLPPSLATHSDPLHGYALQANLHSEQSQFRQVDDSNQSLLLRLLNQHQRQQQTDRDSLLRFLREAEEGKGEGPP